MSEKKIVVPEEMFKAMVHAENHPGYKWDEDVLRVMLEAALRWLSENPIVPTSKDIDDMVDSVWTDAKVRPYQRAGIDIAVEWQRRMFLSFEPEVPEEVKDLLWPQIGKPCLSVGDEHNNDVIEAFRRGKAAK